jgi:probable HAF family extracellular repeat protein
MRLLLTLSKRCLRIVAPAAAVAVALAAVAPGAASAQDAPAPPPPIAGFVLDDGHYQTIDFPGDPGIVDLGRGPEAGARRPRPAAPAEGVGGFLYRGGRFTPLGAVPGAGPSQIHYAINDRGEIAGSYVDAGAEIAADGTYPPEAVHGFVKDRRGHVATFDVPGGTNAVPQGINDRGQVAGIYLDRDLVQTGFVRDRTGNVTTIDLSPIGTKARDINDRGEAVGIYGEPADNELGYVVRSYLRDRDGAVTSIDVPGAGETSPYAIDDRGRIVGSYTDAGVTVGTDGGYPAGSVHAYLHDPHGVTTLDVPGAVLTVALDINDRGQVVGGYIDAAGRQHGFVYDNGRHTTIDAPRPLDPVAMGSIATGINDRGEVVVPEPVVSLVPPREAS